MPDGSVLIITEIDTNGVVKGTKKIKATMEDLADLTSKVGKEMEKDLDGAGNAAKEASKEFDSLFKANLSADLVTDALKNMGEAAVDLAKEAVAAAAEINASNAQFEQTFKGVEKVAKESLNAVAKQAGITASRMQDSYTAIFAFSKSVGADQSQALDISARAMAAAADSAAYYDKSIEEATETLQSFLKGNYENDAALGIAATETTRNAKANELYAKSFNELSEAQKVDTLLAMVEAGNKASGALGQAAREADSWNNVTGELMEAWRLLLGVMGDPLLEGLIPIIQGITSGIQSLIETTASADLASGMEEFKESIIDVDHAFEEASEAIEKNAIMAGLCKQRLAELEAAGLQTAEAQREYANTVDALNGIYPELNLQINEQTGLLDDNSKAHLGNLDAMKKKAGYLAQEKKYTALLNEQENAIQNLEAAQKSLQDVERERETILIQLNQQTGLEADELIRLYASQTNVAAGYAEMGDAAITLTNDQMELVRQFLMLKAEGTNLESGIETLNESISEQSAELETMNAELNDTADSLGIVRDAEIETAATTDDLAASNEELAKKYNDSREAARDSVESQIGYFEELSLKSDATAEKIVENWVKQQEAFANYSANLEKAVAMGYSQKLVESLADGSQKSMIYLDAIVNDHTLTVEEINAAWSNMMAAREPVHDFIAAAENDLIDFSANVTNAINDAGSQAAVGLELAASTVLDGTLKTTKEEAVSTGETIGEALSNPADTMQEAWKGKDQWFESNVESPIKGSVEEIRSSALETWGKMESEAVEAWGRMVENVAAAIRDMQSEINSLTGKTVNITVNKTGSAAASTAYTPSVASAGIPYLATGAVIPPRAPFMAVLGDQPKGLNIETPEALMRQIVREEAGAAGQEVSVNISFSGDLAQLGRILQPVIETETKRIGPSLANSMIIE